MNHKHLCQLQAVSPEVQQMLTVLCNSNTMQQKHQLIRKSLWILV